MIHRLLHHGELTFTALEQGEGPTVLLLHGFPDHASSFRFLIPSLAADGFHAIAPHMRGYQPSSQPESEDYRLSSLAKDIVAFIDELDGGPVHLVGHDWGAVVGYLVAAMVPEKLLSLTTMAIPHPGRLQRELLWKRPSQLAKSWYMFFFHFPWISDFIVEHRDWAFIAWLWRQWSPGWELPEAELLSLKHTFSQPGVKKAALGYYRDNLLLRGPKEIRLINRLLKAKFKVPTLAITGSLDGCMDTRLHDDIMYPSDFPAGLEVVRIEGAGHFLHQEKPNEVHELIVRHLRAHPQPVQGGLPRKAKIDLEEATHRVQNQESPLPN